MVTKSRLSMRDALSFLRKVKGRDQEVYAELVLILRDYKKQK